jgi:hypothetical protein
VDKFKISILEYLGKLDIGVLALISIVYDNKYYEATYFYTGEQLVLTVQEELEEELGHKISKDSEYTNLIRNIINKVVPYDEVYNRLDEVNFDRWSLNDKSEE